MKRALCLLLPAAVAAPLVAAPAEAAPEFWKTFRKTDRALLERVESFGKGNTWFYGYAVNAGASPVLWQWNGKKLVKTKVPGAFKGGVADVDFSSRTNGWAVGYNITQSGATKVSVLRWNGKAWRIVREAATEALFPQVKILGGGAVVVTGITRGEETLLEWRFDGRAWTEVETGTWLTGFSGNYALGSFDNGQDLARWTGKAWKRVKVGARPGGFSVLDRLEVRSAKEIWLTAETLKADGSGTTHVLRWDGKRWTRAKVPVPAKGAVLDIAADGSGGLWVTVDPAGRSVSGVGKKTLLLHRLPSGKWGKTSTKVLARGIARVPGTRSLWAIGTLLPRTEGIFTRGGAR
ncbi:hypothetical protein [Actinocorallia sp. A-T 12471]|uniref:hypothetical protein n=1 Tax=Actinocorallia sp. A-T 12471 TaxID=3089813 RepID=UPI0029CC3E8C|nr:hypothetical protein [Actinocorallia sp. A-T 12471]MDX6740701.1 hypothetical protein [Actinocorallia sp. A-T 12471]